MNQKEFLRTLKIASQGSGRVWITFKKEAEATGYILYLLDMNRCKIILLNESDAHMLRYISEHNQWEDGRVYKIMVTLTKKFNDASANLFISQMLPAIENLATI